MRLFSTIIIVIANLFTMAIGIDGLIKPQGVPHILNGTIIVLGACLSIFVIRRDIATARDERNERLLGELLNEDNAHT